MGADTVDDEYREIADLYDYVVPYRARADVGFFVDAANWFMAVRCSKWVAAPAGC